MKSPGRPDFAGGSNVAMKPPPGQLHDRLGFYRRVLGLPRVASDRTRDEHDILFGDVAGFCSSNPADLIHLVDEPTD